MKNNIKFTLYKDDNKAFEHFFISDCFLEEKLDFEVNNEKYSIYHQNESCVFLKENDEFLFTISVKNGIKSIKYMLKEIGQEMNLNFAYLDYFLEDNKLTICYQVETDGCNNKIVLERMVFNEL